MNNKNDLLYLTRLIPIDCLIEISKVLEHGAEKYSPNGWKTFSPPVGDSIGWYLSKSLGHRYKYITSKTEKSSSNEKESGCHHLAHSIVNLLFSLSLDMNSK